MKSHRKARTSNAQQLYTLRRTRHLSRLRNVADEQLRQRWEFWQMHSINRETIERTLRELMSREQRRDFLAVSWHASSEDLDTLASQAYNTYESRADAQQEVS